MKQAKAIQEVDSIEVVSPQSESSSEDEEVTQMEFASNWNGWEISIQRNKIENYGLSDLVVHAFITVMITVDNSVIQEVPP